MLKELDILNGELSLKFDPLNSKYTVIIDENVNDLNFQYELTNEAKIEISGNEFLENGSLVVIKVFNDKTSFNYYFTVYKKNKEEVNKVVSDLVDLEITPKKEVAVYVGPTIACSCFLIILFLFVFLFHKRKRK